MTRNNGGIAAGIWVIATVAVVFLLRAASQLLIPIVIAVLISYALERVVGWLHQRHVPIVSGGLLVGLVQFGDFVAALKVSGAALVITSLEGWLLTPPLMGKAERMNAVVVFLGVLVWTWIWGAWGTILAVPMLVIVKSIADHTGSLKRVSRLMAP